MRGLRFTPIVALVVVLGIGASACGTDDGREMQQPSDAQIASAQTTTTFAAETTLSGLDGAPIDTTVDGGGSVVLTVTAPWADGDTIPDAFRCAGPEASPEVSWTGVPAEAKSLALVLVDEDAPDYTHWVVANIDPATSTLLGGSVDPNAVQARNSAGSIGFSGPCPPEGQTHAYSLSLYALDQVLEVQNGDDGAAMQNAIYAAAIEAAAVTFTA
ncbi:MAG: YbhB/YbcL family Raf kinase inhibitor-like protein [Actinobacteria bacterium]|nr:YbhB/YbcL family Raf kinase inhibitor-like protein [Actinomycetota bacterium]